MTQDVRTKRYLEIGDRLVERGKLKTAAAVYSRYADVCIAEGCMSKARETVDRDPVTALKILAKAAELQGPTGEGRLLSAQAYRRLGRHEIAERFLRAGP